MGLGNVAAVFAFEWRRAMSPGRIAWWLVLAGFPVFLVVMIRITAGSQNAPREFWPWFLVIMIPLLVSMLGTLMWTSPAVSAELERRSWVYIAIRPNGRTAMLVGKYLAGVLWVLAAALTGLVISVAVAGAEESGRILISLTGITILACPAYAAAYLLIGVLFPQRAMVLAVAYSLMFEVLISLIPAMVNQLTVSWRLRSLLCYWCDIEMPPAVDFATPPAWVHVLMLIAYPLALLTASVFFIRRREFSSAAESET
jgi:ABC-type transport system involved in multi-copper enzyme maturation permease subunit